MSSSIIEVEVIGSSLDCDDDIEWIQRAAFEGCDGKEGDGDFDRGLDVGLGPPIFFFCSRRSARFGRLRLVGADGGAASSRPPQTWGFLLGFCPSVGWELVGLFGVVAPPNPFGWGDFFYI